MNDQELFNMGNEDKDPTFNGGIGYLYRLDNYIKNAAIDFRFENARGVYQWCNVLHAELYARAARVNKNSLFTDAIKHREACDDLINTQSQDDKALLYIELRNWFDHLVQIQHMLNLAMTDRKGGAAAVNQ